MNYFKHFIKKVIWGHLSSSEEYAKYLRKIGVRIGEGISFIDPRTTLIDQTRPWMIEIGHSVCITGGVTVLTHDYGWSVTKAVFGDVIGSCGKVNIGDNVYIGMHSTILPGTEIGNNVIVGANSVIKGKIPDNCVVAGVPARVVRSIDEYHDRRKSVEVQEAIVMAKEYYEVYGKFPPKEIFREHFWIFENKEENLINEYKNVNKLVWGTEKLTKKIFQKNTPKYQGYEQFIEEIFGNIDS